MKIYKKKSDSLLEKTDENRKAAENLAGVYKQLADAQQELKEGALESIKQIIGDGHPSIVLHPVGNRYELSITNKNKYPIYDIDVNALDMVKINQCVTEDNRRAKIIDSTCFDRNNKLITKELNLPAHSTENSLQLFIEQDKPYILTLKFTCKNGIFYYCLNYVKPTAISTRTYKIDRANHNDIILVQETGPRFPDRYWKENFEYLWTMGILRK